MDCLKTGKLISRLRKEKGMTQKQLADVLGISNKTVSKWETGNGAPDVDLIADLASVLEADPVSLIGGCDVKDVKNVFNIKKTNFHVCPVCGNFILSAAKADICCCGRQLAPKQVKKAAGEHAPKITQIGNEWHVEFEHDMEKDHYILFAAYMSWDRLFVIPLYPEQEASFYMPVFPKGGSIIFYCTKHGLFKYDI